MAMVMVICRVEVVSVIFFFFNFFFNFRLPGRSFEILAMQSSSSAGLFCFVQGYSQFYCLTWFMLIQYVWSLVAWRRSSWLGTNLCNNLFVSSVATKLLSLAGTIRKTILTCTLQWGT